MLPAQTIHRLIQPSAQLKRTEYTRTSINYARPHTFAWEHGVAKTVLASRIPHRDNRDVVGSPGAARPDSGETSFFRAADLATSSPLPTSHRESIASANIMLDALQASGSGSSRTADSTRMNAPCCSAHHAGAEAASCSTSPQRRRRDRARLARMSASASASAPRSGKRSLLMLSRAGVLVAAGAALTGVQAGLENNATAISGTWSSGSGAVSTGLVSASALSRLGVLKSP